MISLIKSLKIAQRPITQYGSVEDFIRSIRASNPLDLSAKNWRQANPDKSFREWKSLVQNYLLQHLHYNPGPLGLNPKTLRTHERAVFTLEEIEFNTAPWLRVKGYFLLPKVKQYPVPGLVVFHPWGGPMCWGKERIVNCGRDHPILQKHRDSSLGGRYLAETFAESGYAVIVIDAHHFGERAPRGRHNIDQEIDPLALIPDQYDPFNMSEADVYSLNENLNNLLYLGVRQLNWAGTTWAGLNYWDDSRCIDYLLTRPEVDKEKIGCTGLSGGGWRTNMLAALDSRIRAAVSVGWMTTGDYQQICDVAGTIGTFCLLPGVWNRLDVPDLTVMSASCASMVVLGRKDRFFPLEAQDQASADIQSGYAWAGSPDKFRFFNPPKPHCYDLEIQEAALSWFDQHLKGN